MKPMRWVRGLFALEIASVVVGANCALAQFHHGAPPGYPSVGSYGYAVSGGFSSYPAGYGVGMNPGSSSWVGSSNLYGNLGYGGFGTTPYNYDYGSYGVSPFSVYGYGVTNGVGTGFQSSTSSLRGSTPISPCATNDGRPPACIRRDQWGAWLVPVVTYTPRLSSDPAPRAA